MRTLAITLGLLSLFTSSIIGQTYQPFHFTNANWVVSHLQPSQGGYATKSFFQLSVEGDSIINNEVYNLVGYRSLCVAHHTPNESTYDGGFSSEPIIIGALIERGHSIYFRYLPFTATEPVFHYGSVNFESNVDFLLYDFDAELGDTIFHSSTIYEVVSEVEVYNNERIMYTKNVTDESYPNQADGGIYQGRGSEQGLLAPIYSYYAWSKYIITDEPRNLYECTPCAEFLTNSNDVALFTGNIFFPNPVTDHIFIQEEVSEKIESILITDVQGQVLFKSSQIDKLNRIDLDFVINYKGFLFVNAKMKNGNYIQQKILVLQF